MSQRMMNWLLEVSIQPSKGLRYFMRQLYHWWKRHKKKIFSLSIGLAGGGLAYWCQVPLPWTLGALLFAVLANLFAVPHEEIPKGRAVGQFIIGISLGLYFTPMMVHLIIERWLLLLVGTVLCILSSFIAVYINRSPQLSFATTFFASMPGGASEMVNIGQQFKADPAYVASAHSLRIILLVFMIPAAVTFWVDQQVVVTASNSVTNYWALLCLLPPAYMMSHVWKRFQQPNPWLLGSLVSTGILTYVFAIDSKMLASLLALAQILLSLALARPIHRHFFKRAPQFLLKVCLSTLLIFLVGIVISIVLAYCFEESPFAIYLGIMPGGISELSLTAKTLELNVAVVAAMQVMRLFFIMMMARILYRLMQRWLDSHHSSKDKR